ncbi:MAG: LuxR C-terminal-related transcriptional regulator [Bacilli bacterium]|nr:LuxR C-terminal-related transcriptional regulator [Acholeplasmataceae bacterium]MDY2902017.1 LuxR C-terminal-related transcriptional regulator [Bacilli bacterium]
MDMTTHLLTPRETQIFQLLVQNIETNDIARKLHISEKTVRNHISNVIQKLGVTNRTSAILELIKLKIIKIN